MTIGHVNLPEELVRSKIKIIRRRILGRSSVDGRLFRRGNAHAKLIGDRLGNLGLNSKDVGEFTIMQGAFEANRAWAAFSVMGVILGAAYLLWLYQRTMLGQITNGKNLHLPDLSFREMAVFAPLIAWAIWIGIYPKPYFDVLEKPVQLIVERVRPGYYAGVTQPAPDNVLTPTPPAGNQ